MGFPRKVLMMRAGMKPPEPIATITSGAKPLAFTRSAMSRAVRWMSS